MQKVKSDWESALLAVEGRGWGSVTFDCDGHRVSFRFGRIGLSKLAFIFYLDGVILGEFFNKESSIGKKFGIAKYLKASKRLYSIWRLNFGKKDADSMKKEYESRVVMYNLVYPSAQSVIRVLKKNCQSIVVIQNS